MTMRTVLSKPVVVSLLIALSNMFTAATPVFAAAPQVRTQAPGFLSHDAWRFRDYRTP
jgi:hypothetical protein